LYFTYACTETALGEGNVWFSGCVSTGGESLRTLHTDHDQLVFLLQYSAHYLQSLLLWLAQV